MIIIIMFHVVMLLLGVAVARVVPVQLIADALAYFHTTIGITTPAPAQARMIALIWLAATTVIVDGCLGLFLLIVSIVK